MATKLLAEISRLEADIANKDSVLATHATESKRLHASLSCNVCDELLYAPYMIIECGHVFCRTCLKLWFEQQRSCPQCRQKVYQGPVPAYLVRELVSDIADDLTKAKMVQDSEIVKALGEDVWEGVFPRGRDGALLDYADGVRRCPDCGWEIDSNQCVNPDCNALFDDAGEIFHADDLDETDGSDFGQVDDYDDEADEEDLSFVVGDDVIEYDSDNDDDFVPEGDQNLDPDHSIVEIQSDEEQPRRRNALIVLDDSPAPNRRRRQVVVSDDEEDEERLDDILSPQAIAFDDDDDDENDRSVAFPPIPGELDDMYSDQDERQDEQWDNEEESEQEFDDADQDEEASEVDDPGSEVSEASDAYSDS